MRRIEPDIWDEERSYPAARCRECGVLTYRCSLSGGGYWRTNEEHRRGCSKPPGRLQLLEMVEDQAPELLDTSFGRRLTRSMDTYELDRAALELTAYLARR